jgi:hypothetical protein
MQMSFNQQVWVEVVLKALKARNRRAPEQALGLEWTLTQAL